MLFAQPSSLLLLSALAAAATIASLPIASAWEPGSGGRVMWESNCDFKAADLYSIDTKSERCGDLCADDTRCSHWAWINNDRGGTCWMKSGATNTKLSAAGLGCGYVVGRFNPNGSGGGGGGGSANGLNAVEIQTMLNSINALRANNGIGPLSIDDRLTRAAAAHSSDQATRCTMSHTGGNGSGAGDRVSAQNYRWGWVAENVAGGQTTVEAAMTSWANSAGHRANLLNGNAVHVGFARTVNSNCGNYKQYWTQNFARPL